jgi:hypothetical protein
VFFQNLFNVKMKEEKTEPDKEEDKNLELEE